MSNTARKRTPKDGQQDAEVRLRAVDTEPKSDFADSERILHDIFEQVFDAIRALSSGGDLLIGQCSQFAPTCKIELASGAFSQLVDQSLDISRGPFADLVKNHGGMVLADSVSLCTSDVAFSKLPPGQAALFGVKLEGDVIAVMLYWLPATKGKLERTRIEALKLMASLAGQAAGAGDLSLEVKAGQMQVQSLSSEIREIQEFYKQFSDVIRQCFWVLDTESGKVVTVSDNFERVWGASRQVLADGFNGFMTNVHTGDRDRVLSEFHTQLGQEFESEFRLVGRDGEIRWVWLRAYPAQGSRVVLIADDVTEKKMEEDMVRSREADLVSRARMLAVGDLASGVAHEINNPLTIIVGRADEALRLLAKPSPSFPQLIETIERIQKTSIRISEIVSSLKALSRQEKNMMRRKTPLAKIFADVSDLCVEKFRTGGVKLEIEPFPPEFTAEMDSTLISQLFLNLLNNAFDAVHDKKEKWVRVEHAEDKESVFIFVTDSGPGIPIKSRSRIFDPFFTTKEPGKGTGLGLSLAAGIAAHHNGLIRLDTLNSRTRFVVQIPKTQPEHS